MVQEMTIDELVDSYEEYFPCTFIHRYTKSIDESGRPCALVKAFDIDKAREFVRSYAWEAGSPKSMSQRMAELLPERCLFEELLRAAAGRDWDYLDEDLVRVRVTDE